MYITVAEHPAWMQGGTELAVTVFSTNFRRAHLMQALLAATGTAASVLAWAAGSGVAWLVGGLLLAAVILYTILLMKPINKQLIDPTLDRGSKAAHELLMQWGRRHAVRSVLSLIALSVLVTA